MVADLEQWCFYDKKSQLARFDPISPTFYVPLLRESYVVH